MTEKAGEAVRWLSRALSVGALSAHSALVSLHRPLPPLDTIQLIYNALTAGGLKEVEIITLFGANAALPHASASSTKKLKEGEFALFDVTGSLHGYMSDFTRTMLPDKRSSTWFGFGRTVVSQEWPSARAEKVWQTVKKAQEVALESLVNRNQSHVVYAADVDRAAREVIAGEGWEKYFTHRLGHGELLKLLIRYSHVLTTPFAVHRHWIAGGELPPALSAHLVADLCRSQTARIPLPQLGQHAASPPPRIHLLQRARCLHSRG